MTRVELDHVSKRFGESTVAVDDVSLRIEQGELFFLLGPSGCGKSTLLRLIAGLHEPSAGLIRFNDLDVTHLGTEKRNAVMCFQSYALWPHMSVRENVKFGLDVRRVPNSEASKRIDEVLDLVRMRDLGNRKPNELSGGQQQRIALARALAVKPDCLLLDEPLSNLDAKLRLEMRSEIRRICKTSGITTIYVTHDQTEALSIADRIAVMKDGKLAQVGPPDDLYRRPTSAFVADFLGATNLLAGKVLSSDLVRTTAGDLHLNADRFGVAVQTSVVVSIRPEQLLIGEAGPASANALHGTIIESTYLGGASEHVVQVHNAKLRVISMPPQFGLSGAVTLTFDANDVVVLKE